MTCDDGLQTVQANLPVPSAYFPLGHALHVADEFAPAAALYLPIAQLVQTVFPVESMYLPPAHCVQLEAPWAFLGC